MSATFAIALLVALSSCSAPAGQPGADASPPSTAPHVESPTTPAGARSRPLGTWELSPGIPSGTPKNLPLPQNRWIKDMSRPFDAKGGMVELGVDAVEFEQAILDFKAAGWTFGSRHESSGRIGLTGYAENMTQAVDVTFAAATPTQDSHLTVTYVASLPPRP